jgi:uncharacterized OB-fold protein
MTEATMDWAHGTPIMIGPWMLGLGDPSPETNEYWAGVADKKLLLKKCTQCGRANHPRRLFCLDCRNDVFDWVEAAGTGTIYTYSKVDRGPTDAFQAETPYTIGLIELDEGVFFCTRVLADDQDAISIGAPVSLTWAEVGSFGELPVFNLA